jgi:hypothetical protein
MPDADVVCELLLQLADLRPEDVTPMVKHALNARVDLLLELTVLGLQIDKLHGFSLDSSLGP